MKKLTLLLFFTLFSHNLFAFCNGTDEILTVSDPIKAGDFTITSRVYRPLMAPGETFPVVFILPPIVGETPLDGALALNMCLQGMGAYILNLRNDPTDAEQVSDLNTHEDGFIRAEFGLQELLKQLKNDPEISGQFGIMGASYGGILAAYLIGVQPELKASVLMAASGNIDHVLAYSEQEAIKNLRMQRMSAFNLSSQSAYEDFIRSWITRDPIIFTKSVPANSTMIFVLTRDRDVPTSDQRQLARALPSPKIITLNQTHIPGIVEAATVYSQQIINFFRSKLR